MSTPQPSAAILGFGCASLGSRIGERDGRLALARAIDAGVTHFDVAPAYGRGAAEDILGRFIREAAPGPLRICTKVGLVPPPTSGPLKALMPLARRAIAAAAPLRGLARRAGAGRNRATPLTAATIRASIDASLTRLGLEQVAIYALHNAAPEDLSRDDVRRALEDVLAAGKAAEIGVASSHDAAEAAIALGEPYGVVQFALDVDGRAEAVFDMAHGADVRCILHSVFGIDGAMDRLLKAARTPDGAAALSAAGYDGPPKAAIAELLLDRALALNLDGVTLASMFTPEHLAGNLARAAQAPRSMAPGLVKRLAALVQD
jgi:aryl-alcohol dehydrogenase-like predicted oxidoreductase